MFASDIFNELVNRHHENKLAHAFLLETNDLEKCYNDLIKFIKYINCDESFSDNCSSDSCHLCSLIDNGNLPSFMRIDPDGTQIKKGQVQEVIERFQTFPVFSKYNIYVICECDKLNAASANSLLKFLEEPEDSIIGFYITNNRMNVISTIRSRCQEYSVYYKIDDNDFSYLEKIRKYLNDVYRNDNAILYNKIEALGYCNDRVEWITFFKQILFLLYSYIKDKSNDFDILLLRDSNDSNLIKIIDLLETILKYLQSNGNIELILDKFVLEMRNFYA